MNKGCNLCAYRPRNIEEFAIAKQNPTAYCPDAYTDRSPYCNLYDKEPTEADKEAENDES